MDQSTSVDEFASPQPERYRNHRDIIDRGDKPWPLCKWQRQSANSVRAKERDDGRFFSIFVYAFRVGERHPIPPYHFVSLTRADMFQAGLSPLSVISCNISMIETP